MADSFALESDVIRVPDTVEAVNDHYHAQGLTDGLPIIPPTAEAVQRMLAYTDRSPWEVVAVLPPQKGQATVEKIAINAVMAGCLPPHFPVVLTAIQALAEESYNLYGVLATTHPCSNLVIVNGPIARELDINAGYNALGQGWRSNASIGRAVRLVMINISGARPGILDRATQGTPAKYAYCFAENEAQSPWEPFHVERGYAADTSTVTVLGAEGPHNINDHGSTSAEEILNTMAGTMAILGCNNAFGTGEPMIIFGPEHAATVAADGFTKPQIKAWLYEHSKLQASRFSAGNFARFTQRGWAAAEDITPDTFVATAASADSIHVVVAGGAGKHSCFIPTFGHTQAITLPLALKDQTPAASIEDFRR
ncbi:MAG: hypothetical protein OEU26_03070 [Candidatus Tectomicrobia bacterium]|nr:hypothetical protein [Candidatus Tectomicrobia bacterium]